MPYKAISLSLSLLGPSMRRTYNRLPALHIRVCENQNGLQLVEKVNFSEI